MRKYEDGKGVRDDANSKDDPTFEKDKTIKCVQGWKVKTVENPKHEDISLLVKKIQNTDERYNMMM